MASSSVFGTAELVVGAESLLANRAAKARVGAARQEHPGVEVVELQAADLADGSFTQIIGGSLFSPETVVTVRDLANLPPELTDAILAVARDVPANLCLTLVHEGGQKGKALLTALGKCGVTTVKADPIKAHELPRFVVNEAKRARIWMDTPAAQALIRAVGSNLSSLVGALTQLASDWEGEKLTESMINRYFAGRAEVSSFQVADDTLDGHTGEALAKLRWALTTGVAPVLITSAMAIQLRALGKYLEARSSRMGRSDIAREIGVPYWKIESLDKQARHWSAGGVAKAIIEVARADADVKGAATDAEFALERLVLSVSAARG